ncbi:dehydrogenase [Polymorphobacter glacialis]|uniref:Dehydrogenase n=1 Tax=Sandarakinorhabdus glacialis TaxID=1614636 RepID=A0A917E9T8_9SPHN|nr:SDR family oxidoreductase [Polymorphobacter glacialis]GGE14752.1 dehydrogenase [Polymorphobacter glacialis]
MSRLHNRRILVTGAANGLGLACAVRFIAEGARVLLTDIDTENGQSAAETLGPNAAFIPCDVSSRPDIAAAIENCVSRWGGIDVLVNNAGIAPRGDILTTDEALFDRVLAINLKAAFHATQLAAPHMIAQAKGVIINMSSVNAVLTIPTLLAYNVAKGGLNQLTRNTAVALAPHGIRVCGIGPGTILTELAKNAVLSDEAARRMILSRTPLGRAGEPSEIAAIAAFLASDDASYITGETIYADGGRLGLNYTVAVD